MSTDINTTNPYKRYEATVWRNDEKLIRNDLIKLKKVLFNYSEENIL